jgi:hypothetical protein
MPYQELTGGLMSKIDRCRLATRSRHDGHAYIIMILAQP